MSVVMTVGQIPDKSILDAYNKQAYLGNQFIYGLPVTSIGGTSETPILLFKNPAVTVPGKALFLIGKKLTCMTASHSAVFRFYADPTITSNGTDKSTDIVNVRPASSTASIAKIYRDPSASSNGTYIAALASSNFVSDASDVLSIFDQGQSLLITVQVSNVNDNVVAELIWYEI